MEKKHVESCRVNGADQGFDYRVDVCKRDDQDRGKTFEGRVGYEILQRVYNPADAKRSCVSLRSGYPNYSGLQQCSIVTPFMNGR